MSNNQCLRVKLSEVCEIVSGTTPKTSNATFWDGDIKWITPAEIESSAIEVHDSIRHITERGRASAGLQYFPRGTVILSSRAPIGKVAIAGTEMTCNQGFKNLICGKKIHNRYLYFFLKSKTDFLNSLGRGATFKEISKKIVSDIEVPLPPLDKQQHIADVLTAIVNLIAQRKEQNKKFEVLAKSRFIEMFGDPIKNPKKWNNILLDDFCEVGSSKRIFEKEYVSAGVPFYRTKEVVELAKGNNITTELFISKTRFGEILERFGVPQKNDLLITAVGTIGIIWVVDKTPFYFKDGNLLRITYNKKFNPIYLKFVLEQLLAEHKKQMSAGTAYAALTITDLKKMKLYDVPLSLQNEFAAFIEQLDKSKFTIRKSLEQLETLYRALLQEYFG